MKLQISIHPERLASGWFCSEKCLFRHSDMCLLFHAEICKENIFDGDNRFEPTYYYRACDRCKQMISDDGREWECLKPMSRLPRSFFRDYVPCTEHQRGMLSFTHTLNSLTLLFQKNSMKV